MDVLEDQRHYEEALIAIKLRNRRWDVVTGGLIAVAILLTCHAVKAGLWRHDLALANLKVNKEVTTLAHDIDQLQHEINKKKGEGNALTDNIKRLDDKLLQVRRIPGKHLDLGSVDLLSEELRRAQEEVDTARGKQNYLTKTKRSAQDDSLQVRRALAALRRKPHEFIKPWHFVYSVSPFKYKEAKDLGLHLGLTNKKVKVLNIVTKEPYMIQGQNNVQSRKLEIGDTILVANGREASSDNEDMEAFLRKKHSGNLVLVVKSKRRWMPKVKPEDY